MHQSMDDSIKDTKNYSIYIDLMVEFISFFKTVFQKLNLKYKILEKKNIKLISNDLKK